MRYYRSGHLIRPDLQAHIDSEALLGNVAALRSLTPADTRFCAVVKANAYGHGITEIVGLLREHADYFAVASLYEALHIAYLVETQPILILEPLNVNQPAEQVHACAEENFHCVISDEGVIEYASSILKNSRKQLGVHVNIETGMGRYGIEPDAALRVIEQIEKAPNLELAGVFTHFATADEQDLSYVHTQIERFDAFLDSAKGLIDRSRTLVHAANSAATIKLPQSHYDMVRCGISMYGYYSRPMPDATIELKPVMKLTAPLVHIKRMDKGEPVSYGRSYVTERETLLGMIPLGYADGYWRAFSNQAKMKIGDSIVPVVGRVCMDQILVDITDVPDPRIGQEVTLIDNDHNSPCGVYALSELADTICYEILTCVHAHVKRIIH